MNYFILWNFCSFNVIMIRILVHSSLIGQNSLEEASVWKQNSHWRCAEKQILIQVLR